MSIAPQVCPPSTDPTLTTFAERRAIALSLLNHRPASGLLCELVIAAMQGASLLALVEMETASKAVTP